MHKPVAEIIDSNNSAIQSLERISVIDKKGIRGNMEERHYIKVKKCETDICNICKQRKKLTWDHVPPRGVNLPGDVYAGTFFDSLPDINDYGKKYQSGIKYRTICENCNNVVLGEKDKWLKEFEVTVGKNVLEMSAHMPRFLKIDVPINKICKSICGHLLAAKDSIDECIVDERMREYVLSGTKSAEDCGIKIFSWLYLYNTTCVMRDVVTRGMNNNEMPKGMISFFSSFPLSFIVGVDDLVVPGLDNLGKYTTNNLDDIVSITIDCESVYYPGTKDFKHFMWPCNVGDDVHDASFVLCSETAMNDSRIGMRIGK